jgi:hypothetical protein
MEVNVQKSCIIPHLLSEFSSQLLSKMLPFPQQTLDGGFKYLGFFFKPDGYKSRDWSWLLKKMETLISLWGNRLISRGGRLVLIKLVLESIPVYWTSIATMAKGILTKIKNLFFYFLWYGSRPSGVTSLFKWRCIDILNKLGG